MPLSRASVLRRPIDLPAGTLAARIGSWNEPALLEGGPDLGPSGRWSILAARPRRILESRDGSGFRWSSESLDIDSAHDVFDGLARFADHYGLAGPADHEPGEEAPFQGGLIGYLGYDLAPRLEELPRKAPSDSRLPSLRFGLYDTFVLVDHQSNTREFWAVDLLDEGESSLEARWDLWKRDLEIPPRNRPSTIRDRPSSDQTRPDYLDAVRKVLAYIEAGDIYQANLSQRFVAHGSIQPLDLYQRLQAVSPAPFASYLAWDDLAIVGASPELFYRTEGDRIVTRPIKGTRPRSSDPSEDARLIAELLASTKDQAELTMIVDLERNDLGRICRFGSVQVSDPGAIESFAQVHHRVATVEGRLRPEIGPVDVIRAVFPGGSITGAPKIRAMEIIDELEPHQRSVYTGAVGYLSRGGRAAFNIAIRTILVEGDRISYQVGGGIVADSDPDQEYAETLDKARGMRRVLDELGEAR